MKLSHRIRWIGLSLCSCLLLLIAIASAQAKTTATIELTTPGPSGLETAETEEYRSLVWKDPWDMDNKEDIVQLDSPCVQQNQYTSMSFTNGIWTGQANPTYSTGHWVFLLTPGYRDSLPVGIDGRLRPIDPAVYTQLTIKMYIDNVDPQSEPGARLFWTKGDIGSFGNAAEGSEWGESNYIRTYSGWHIYTIDLTQIGLLGFSNGKMNWTDADKITGLRLDPANTSLGKDIRIDWIRLSPKNNDQIAWTASDISQNSTIEFALNSNDGMGNVPIHSYTNNVQFNVAQEDRVSADAQSYSFPGSLPPGDYTLQASIERASDTGAWTVNAKPILSFSNPSTTSGQEYASTVLNDPWDLESLSDIEMTQDIISSDIENGIYRGTHGPTGDPCSEKWSDSGVFLNVGPPIDPNVYRYLVYRVRLDGTADISNGWMSRVTWYDPSGFPNVGTSDDIIVRDGWNEHIIDMWRDDLPDNEEPGPRKWRDNVVAQLRLDPDEVPQTQTFYIDYVRLYAESVAQGQFNLAWTVSESNTTIALGYDTDSQGFDGTEIAQNVTGQSYSWDTSRVPPGRYYVYATVSDGVNQTRFYSDAPLRILADPSSFNFSIYLPTMTSN